MRLSEGPLAEGLQLFALFGLAVAAPIEIDTGSLRPAQTSPAAWAATRIVGHLAPEGGPEARPTMAIAVGGALQPFVPALPGRDGSLVFAAQISEHAFRGDPSELALFVAGGSPQAPVLHPAAIELGAVDLRGVGVDFTPPARGAVR